MADGDLHFPLHMNAAGKGFVIDKDEATDPTSPPYDEQENSHLYLSPEEQGGVRLKRRRRCGQCGPCQVKENCNKCHYCVRKDVLKQTCVYRKCVYLRSKPKPYSRQPKEVIPLNVQRLISSPPQRERDNSCVPVSLHQASSPSFTNNLLSKTATDSHNTGSSASSVIPGFPFSLPHGPSPPESGIKLPSQDLQGPSPPVSEAACSGKFEHLGSISGNHGILSGISNPDILEKSHLNDFRSPVFPHGPLSMPFPPSIRDSSSMMNMHYPGYGRSLVSDARTNVRSPCMYTPSLPPSLPSALSSVNLPFDRGPMRGTLERPPNGPTYLPNSSEVFRPYASIPSVSHTHPYSTHGSFPHTHPGYPSSSSYGYPALGMHPPPNVALPHPMPGSSFQSSPLSSLNQSSGCPKNGQCPPVSQTLDTQLMQERYGCIHSIKDSTHNSKELSPLPSESCTGDKESSAAAADNTSMWGIFNIRKNHSRSTSVLSDDTGRLSITSSDFECDVIGIDDLQVNALIRSDGCNSIEIEIDDSASEAEASSGRKSVYSDSNSEKSSSVENTPEKTFREIPRTKKCPVKGTVYLKQDLGDEGIIQLEIPGHKVTLENSYLDDTLAQFSSNVDELLDFIRKAPKFDYFERNC